MSVHVNLIKDLDIKDILLEKKEKQFNKILSNKNVHWRF